MTSTTDPGPRSSVPWALLGMIALVGLIERFEFRENLDFMDNVVLSWKYTGKVVRRKAPGNDILCFGDSLVKFGVLPRVVQAKTGRRAYSLAVLSGSAPSSYFLLRRALEAHARPKAVVVDFARGILGDGPASVTRPYPWAELLNLRECLELSRTARDADLLGSIAVRWLLPSEGRRFEVRAHVLGALKSVPTSQSDVALALWRNWNTNAGGQANPKVGPFPDPVIPDQAATKPGTWTCHPVNEVYVRRFLDTAASRGITVYWLLPPVTPGTLSHWVHSGDERRYLDFVRRQQARYSNVVVIDGRYSGFRREVFVDGVHLDRDGAAALSAGVGAILRTTMSGPTPTSAAWIQLANFGDLPAEPAIEDVGQSRIALKTVLEKRRQ